MPDNACSCQLVLGGVSGRMLRFCALHAAAGDLLAALQEEDVCAGCHHEEQWHTMGERGNCAMCNFQCSEFRPKKALRAAIAKAEPPKETE